MTLSIYRIFSLCALLVLTVAMRAEDVVAVDFKAITWQGRASGLLFQTSDEVKELRLNSQVFSPEQRYEGPPRITFFRETQPGPSNQPPERRKVADVTIPPDSTELILIFIRKAGPVEAYSVVPIQSDLPNFPLQYLMFWNLSRNEIACTLGDSVTWIDPGDSALLYREAEGPDSGKYAESADLAFGKSINVQIATRSEGKLQRIFRGRWSISENSRILAFAYPFQDGDVRVKHITEIVDDSDPGGSQD